MKKERTLELRLSDELIRKLYYVSSAENRTPNAHIIMTLRQNIAYYERVHGKIKDSELAKIKLDGDDGAVE
ncbi:MAG: hypothetical protein LUE25_04045 [Clostridiales bacterium]|nr:hypothetical protein [Clostridiales bacterium]